MKGTALIAGSGMLPGLLASALRAAGEPFVLAEFDGHPATLPEGVRGPASLTFRLERLVPLIENLVALDVGRVCFAGAVRRPALEAELFDARTASLLPRLLAALRSGDDGALRAIVATFEEFGLEVVGADVIAPDLVPGPGVLAGAPTEADRADAGRAAEIVAGLGGFDLGQGAVVAQGLCLAVETLPGTDAMLDFVARTGAGLRPDPKGARGVLYKGAKPGQDRRIDLPVIGPETVRGAHAAGLAGIAWQAGSVLLLDRAAVVAAAGAAGLFLWSRPS